MKKLLRILAAALAGVFAAVSAGIPAYAAPENISAVSAIVIEAQTGTVLWEHNSRENAPWRAPRR